MENKHNMVVFRGRTNKLEFWCTARMESARMGDTINGCDELHDLVEVHRFANISKIEAEYLRDSVRAVLEAMGFIWVNAKKTVN